MMVALSTADSIALVVWHPNTVWKLYLQDIYKGLVNLCVMTASLAYIQGTLSESWFSNLFMFLSIVSLIPSVLASLLQPVIDLIKKIKSLIDAILSFASLFGNPVAARGTAAAVLATGFVIASGDHDAKLAILDAADEDAKSSQDPNRPQYGHYHHHHHEDPDHPNHHHPASDRHGHHHDYPESPTRRRQEPQAGHAPHNVWNGDHNRELQQRASAPVAGMGLVHSWMVYETGASNLFKASSGNQLHFPRSHEEGSYRTTSGYAV
mmetsp:Transcript_45295/g.106281  ORF Transcript_45295/g.106281 Transcript_45295/m.106281 type:complete len:265 (+) Transcript_45295:1124-1918(+)